MAYVRVGDRSWKEKETKRSSICWGSKEEMDWLSACTHEIRLIQRVKICLFVSRGEERKNFLVMILIYLWAVWMQRSGEKRTESEMRDPNSLVWIR